MAPRLVMLRRWVLATITALGAAGGWACQGDDQVSVIALVLEAGNGQSAQQRNVLPQPLIVRVVDAAGDGRRGVDVRFRTSAGHGWIGFDSSSIDSTVVTDASGLASVRWRLGTLAAETLTVTVAGHPATLRFTATALPVTYALEALGGDGQAAVVGSTLPVAPRVRLEDNTGAGVAGAAVTFIVTVGGGSITGATPTTDANGIAELGSWTLGPNAGTNRVQAYALGVSIEFTAEGRAPTAPASVTVVAGANQTAAPDSFAATPPAVRVDDGTGQPVSGTLVRFRVVGGGGAVTPDTIRTNGSGIATAATWRMGPTPSSNLLEASVAGVPPDTITATGRRDLSTMSIVSTRLLGLAINRDTLNISVRVSSTYQLTGVSYRAFGDSESLTYSPSCWPSSCWYANVPLGTASFGVHDVVVSATDVFSNTEDEVFRVTVDRPPQVTVTEPRPGTVAATDVRITASCVDDAPQGCAGFEISLPQVGVVISQGANDVNLTYSMAAWTGQTRQIVFRGWDRNGFVDVVRLVEVVPAGRLAQEATATGTVLDYDGTRTLHLDEQNVLRMLSGANDARLDSLGGPLIAASVVPQGAIAAVETATNAYRLYAWKGGPAADLGSVSAARFSTAGNYVAWIDGGSGLRLHNLATGATTLIAALPNGGTFAAAADGSVIYTGYDAAARGVWRYSAGTSTMLPSDTAYDHREPVTDGSLTVYARSAISQVSPASILLNDGTTQNVLAPATSIITVTAGPHYQVNGGWVTFVQVDAQNRPQVWTRSPADVLRQITFFTTPSRVDALGADGSVVVVNAEQGRFYAPPTGPASGYTNVGTLSGRVVWRNGSYYVLIGRHVFRILP